MQGIRLATVIGLGGIGSALIDPLCRFLNSTYGNDISVEMIDGDVYDEKNHERQNFNLSNIGEYKSEYHAKRIDNTFSRLCKVMARNEYITNSNSMSIIKENSVVFSCVDNHKTRRNIQEACANLNDVILISGGNEYTDGNVQSFMKKKGRFLTPRIDDERYHPEINNPKDRSPDEISCEELIEEGSEPQLIFTNLSVATNMLNTFYLAINNKLKYQELYFDILTGKQATFTRSL
jgi:molybdopterin/thiamine biosynthesis adenylyltransferase